MRSGTAGLSASAALLAGLLVGGWARAASADVVSFAGDWGGDGVDTLGTFDPATGEWSLWSRNFDPLVVVFASGAGVPGAVPVVGDWDGDGIDTIGLYDPADGRFRLKNSNGPGPWESTFRFGVRVAGVMPLAGDWDGDGVDTIGLYDPVRERYYLRNDSSSGQPDLIFSFSVGVPGLVPVMGDWDGDGDDTPGLFRAPHPDANGFAKWFLRDDNSPGRADMTFRTSKNVILPVVGDWNADGADTTGVQRLADQRWFISHSNTRQHILLGNGLALSPPDLTRVPLAGDWDGDGADGVGFYEPGTGIWVLRNGTSAGPHDDGFRFSIGVQGLLPLVGDWDGNGVDTVGLYNPITSCFFLRNAHSAGHPDLVFRFGVGLETLVPAAGDWDGDGVDTIGLFDPRQRKWCLRDSNSAGQPDTIFRFFNAFDPVVGDWNADGVSTTGTSFFRGRLLFWKLREANSAALEHLALLFPIDVALQDLAGRMALAGDWNADGIDTLALFVAPTWLLRNSNTDGPADVTFDFDPLGP